MNLETLIEENYGKLNESDLYIWNYILHHKKECQTMSIKELALECNTSHTTILRFARKLGLQGYSEMKIYLKWENMQGNNEKNKFDDREIQKVYKDIEKTIEVMKKTDFKDIFQLFEKADKIYIYGTGSVQKSAAKDLKRNMIPVKKLIYVLEGREESNIILDYLSSKDIFFLLSLSGNNTFMNEFARRLKKIGIKIISITQVGNNELASLSDISLQFYTHSFSVNGQIEVSTTTQFFLINQILLLKYLEYKMSVSL
ncbi:HTH-type transcriptional regulator GlvR [Clostridium pasteurianum DSM 525 = ATCC 6013]|uniref:HTH-type transcriptional regulator GlvR n=1 Tax=Clostridium pasteurianum DSM 525 = ATCC 6013 TaxID=1262449 RepID=A0A0H3JA58_CLOPA|nr:MurR/RpiR family transcriptional regulator [Clostridium pasteurianum]AJA49263.1 HTH-type transcriptional regulator GlvR [Clostridium pasteurianum DSM 525 = ATCC 6013]AJA53251.1 HTH-type transcriptional regulator GlvR [Clostridium pasteurianum DSM 525 = ATCC 6013]AOZ76441.1 RpiR family transcriptional regulator [Clostridium pasteurianum DSM 525 = ATCC 6013]AOZ80238.1 RpiR family transcriptional regulator [Clostridium pasteurianum]ELP58283.1 RpiR family transcriptional regulator [Clostridium 